MNYKELEPYTGKLTDEEKVQLKEFFDFIETENNKPLTEKEMDEMAKYYNQEV